MKRSSGPAGLLSLLIVLVGVGLFVAWQYGGLGQDGVPAAGEGPVDISRAPRDVASNPRAARQFAEASVCASSCVSTDRVCRGTAGDAPALASCAEALETCRSGCNVAP